MYAIRLNNRKLHLATSGGGTIDEKVADKINLDDGCWLSGTASKPPRWLIQFWPKNGGGFEIRTHDKIGRKAGILTSATTKGRTAAVSLRLLPLIRTTSGFVADFDWEWLLVLTFDSAMPDLGNSARILSFDLKHNLITLFGRMKSVDARLCDHALIGLVDPSDEKVFDGFDAPITYGDATSIIAEFIMSDPPREKDADD